MFIFIDVQPSKNLPLQSKDLQMKESDDYQEFDELSKNKCLVEIKHKQDPEKNTKADSIEEPDITSDTTEEGTRFCLTATANIASTNTNVHEAADKDLERLLIVPAIYVRFNPPGTRSAPKTTTVPDQVFADVQDLEKYTTDNRVQESEITTKTTDEGAKCVLSPTTNIAKTNTNVQEPVSATFVCTSQVQIQMGEKANDIPQPPPQQARRSLRAKGAKSLEKLFFEIEQEQGLEICQIQG